jgi:hypothetical protein
LRTLADVLFERVVIKEYLFMIMKNLIEGFIEGSLLKGCHKGIFVLDYGEP